MWASFRVEYYEYYNISLKFYLMSIWPLQIPEPEESNCNDHGKGQEQQKLSLVMTVYCNNRLAIAFSVVSVIMVEFKKMFAFKADRASFNRNLLQWQRCNKLFQSIECRAVSADLTQICSKTIENMCERLNSACYPYPFTWPCIS